MRNLITVLLLYCCCYGLVTACGRGRHRSRCRRSPPPDKTKPTISCPHDIHQFADPLQVNTKVWWDEKSVVANDDRDGAIKPTRTGQDPGKIYPEGVTTIKYHARDKSGNFVSCSFTITVEVIRCSHWGSVSDGWKICHVSYDMRLGSICKFGCYSGHELVGVQRTECLISRQWDVATQPYCQQIQCDALIPTSGQYDMVDIVCTEENYYRSQCLYNCADGYNVLPGHNKVRVCNEYGSWIGNTPMCVDTEAPVYSTCPYVKVGYAERSKITGRVWWNQPLATDNSGKVTVVQIVGPSSGSELGVGQHNLKYMAYDDVNNTAICEFNVIVKQIKCHAIYPLPYTSVVCPKGRIFGSLCEFVCDNGTSLNGQANVECDKSGSVIPSGVWSFDNNQPYCENQNTCPALRAPDNGALACDTWISGRYCQMLCEEGYVVMDDPVTELIDEVLIQKNLLVCADSGTWYLNGDIPNCQEVDERLLQILRIDIDYLYYEGECNESRNDIKEKFITAFTTSTSISCQPPACSIGNVQIVCGDVTGTTSKRKRSISSILQFQVSMELSTDLNPTEIVKSRQSIKVSLKYAEENGDLGLTIDGIPINPTEIDVSQPEVTCNAGSAFDKKTIQCVKCNAGYYHDTVNDVCSPCARGKYQDEAKQTTCTQCPPGKTTEKKGARSSIQCVDACPAGTYSPTGTSPCSACDLGWYSVDWGTAECTQCPGNQITLNPGASSITQCQEFDITYTVLDDTEEFSAATFTSEVGVPNTFVMALWVKCIQCDNIVTIVGEDGSSILSVINTDQLTIQLFGNLYDAGEDLAGSMLWKQVTVIYIGAQIKVYLNERELLKESVLNSPPTMPASLNVTLGGEGFIGSLSQLNMWSDLNAHSPAVTNTCFKASKGDVISWRQVSEVDGSFVITNSYCDAEDNCESSPCQNSGSCKDSIRSYVCTCRGGYTGSACETNIDDCHGNACYSGSTCIDGDDDYTCECPDGLSGKLCEIKVVDGGWSEWGISGACSVTCGIGLQQSSRICENPIPIHGGKVCDGSNIEYITCDTNTDCVNECTNDPSDIENGNMNCNWTDNDTRVCNPTCNEGFDFDSEMFTSGIVCGPDTGYTWSHNNTDNPNGQLPSCTAKEIAVSNKVNFTAEYHSLPASTSEVFSAIADKVNANVRKIGCVATGRCEHEGTSVYSSEETTDRKRRDTTYVMFTIELICNISSDMDECYDLLADVVATLESYITQLQFTIQYGGNDYDVGLNSSSLEGTSTCDPGHVPVWQYCISCGKGTYAADDYCKECTYGYYQDEEAQTYCKECPEGWTTAGLMTRDKKYCNISDPVDNSVMKWLLIGLATAGAVVVVVVMLLVVTLLICKSIKSKKNRTNGLSMYSASGGRMENSNVRFAMHTMRKPQATGPEALDNPGYMQSEWDSEEFTTIPLPRYSAVSPPPMLHLANSRKN